MNGAQSPDSFIPPSYPEIGARGGKNFRPRLKPRASKNNHIHRTILPLSKIHYNLHPFFLSRISFSSGKMNSLPPSNFINVLFPEDGSLI